MRKRPEDRPERLDLLLVARGLAQSRERAQALVLAGQVEVEGRRATKAGERVHPGARVVVLGPDHPYAGRGGVKLAGALTRFGIDPTARVALDVGASIGGFTDCLLQRGAKRVYALDVGSGQLHDRLRRDPRVVVVDHLNARNLRPDALPERVSLVTVDVAFISLRLVLPPLPGVLAEESDLVPLVKPQFEVGRREVGPGGIVRDRDLHRRVVGEIVTVGRGLGLGIRDLCVSPLPGAEGNIEYFLHFRTKGASLDPAEIAARIEKATAG